MVESQLPTFRTENLIFSVRSRKCACLNKLRVEGMEESSWENQLSGEKKKSISSELLVSHSTCLYIKGLTTSIQKKKSVQLCLTQLL